MPRAARVTGALGLALGLVLAAACTTGDGGVAREPDTPEPDATSPSPAPAPAADFCAEAARAEGLGPIQSDLDELSGLAVAADGTHLWAISDSGPAALFAFDPAGTALGAVAIPDAAVTDWEDLARGPAPDAPGTSALYVADIGDNRGRRDTVQIVVVNEPAVGDATVAARLAVVASYPDGPRDAEALFVDPTTGDVYVIDKVVGPDAHLYRLTRAAMTAGSPATFERVGSVTLPSWLGLVTSADISADGTTIAVRTYTDVFVFAREPDESVADALSRDPCRAPRPDERQGEAIAFAPDGRAIYSAPEGVNPPLTRIVAG